MTSLLNICIVKRRILMEMKVFCLFCFLDFFFFPFSQSGTQGIWMVVPRLGVESELQLPPYATATAMPDLSHVCDLQHNSWQCQILNPMGEARDRTCNLMVPSWIHFCCTTMGTPGNKILITGRKNGFITEYDSDSVGLHQLPPISKGLCTLRRRKVSEEGGLQK